jgi:hypothetical protein
MDEDSGFMNGGLLCEFGDDFYGSRGNNNKTVIHFKHPYLRDWSLQMPSVVGGRAKVIYHRLTNFLLVKACK